MIAGHRCGATCRSTKTVNYHNILLSNQNDQILLSNQDDQPRAELVKQSKKN